MRMKDEALYEGRGGRGASGALHLIVSALRVSKARPAPNAIINLLHVATADIPHSLHILTPIAWPNPNTYPQFP